MLKRAQNPNVFFNAFLLRINSINVPYQLPFITRSINIIRIICSKDQTTKSKKFIVTI